MRAEGKEEKKGKEGRKGKGREGEKGGEGREGMGWLCSCKKSLKYTLAWWWGPMCTCTLCTLDNPALHATKLEVLQRKIQLIRAFDNIGT